MASARQIVDNLVEAGMSRRDFIGRTAAGVAASGISGTAGAASSGAKGSKYIFPDLMDQILTKIPGAQYTLDRHLKLGRPLKELEMEFYRAAGGEPLLTLPPSLEKWHAYMRDVYDIYWGDAAGEAEAVGLEQWLKNTPIENELIVRERSAKEAERYRPSPETRKRWADKEEEQRVRKNEQNTAKQREQSARKRRSSARAYPQQARHLPYAQESARHVVDSLVEANLSNQDALVTLLKSYAERVESDAGKKFILKTVKNYIVRKEYEEEDSHAIGLEPYVPSQGGTDPEWLTAAVERGDKVYSITPSPKFKQNLEAIVLELNSGRLDDRAIMRTSFDQMQAHLSAADEPT